MQNRSRSTDIGNKHGYQEERGGKDKVGLGN